MEKAARQNACQQSNFGMLRNITNNICSRVDNPPKSRTSLSFDVTDKFFSSRILCNSSTNKPTIMLLVQRSISPRRLAHTNNFIRRRGFVPIILFLVLVPCGYQPWYAWCESLHFVEAVIVAIASKSTIDTNDLSGNVAGNRQTKECHKPRYFSRFSDSSQGSFSNNRCFVGFIL